jgi:hypothetical protein
MLRQCAKAGFNTIQSWLNWAQLGDNRTIDQPAQASQRWSGLKPRRSIQPQVLSACPNMSNVSQFAIVDRGFKTIRGSYNVATRCCKVWRLLALKVVSPCFSSFWGRSKGFREVLYQGDPPTSWVWLRWAIRESSKMLNFIEILSEILSNASISCGIFHY